MTPRIRVLSTSALIGALAFGTLTGASALWSVNDAVVVPALRSGSVSFAVQDAAQTAPPQVSEQGGTVAVTIPGEVIAGIVGQTGAHPDPIIWRFAVTGAAQGIAGLDYDLIAAAQVGPGGEHPLGDGVAQKGTLLAEASLRIYPAGLGDDCALVPDLPDDPDRNVYLWQEQGHVLQAPHTNLSGAPITQTWCVAIAANGSPDGRYANDARAAGIGEDGLARLSVDRWNAAVAFPVSLAPLGVYRNRAVADGRAQDDTSARDEASWEASVFPDPAGEPGVRLELSPRVTTVGTVPTP